MCKDTAIHQHTVLLSWITIKHTGTGTGVWYFLCPNLFL
uniref:Uncharacterized protein n=1 Tax=Anguilla anguilla TaxID=7936 RepID=A0A0E9V677_ANGAN